MGGGVKPMVVRFGDVEAHVVVLMMVLEEPLSKEGLLDIVNGSNADVLVVTDLSSTPQLQDLVYYLYLAYRNVRQGLSIARDPNIEAFLYTQCTSQIIEANELGSPVGARAIAIAALSIGKDPVVKLPTGDMAIGLGSRLSRVRCGRGDVILRVLERARPIQLAAKVNKGGSAGG